jgi:hypothetical protein
MLFALSIMLSIVPTFGRVALELVWWTWYYKFWWVLWEVYLIALCSLKVFIACFVLCECLFILDAYTCEHASSVFSPIEKFQVYLDIITLVGMWIEPFKYIMQPHKNIERGWGEANVKHDWCKEDKLQSSIHCFNVSPNRRRDLECGVCNPLQVKWWQCQVFV